jgi:NADH:ubiquinone oxidoreductase subunit 5 (subunit L)/multisubunit Na+/H+ antiporter MnhA subunit
MAAGLVYAALGHDRIGDLAGVARAMPVTMLAFAVAGLALMGILPSGAYLAKKLLLESAAGSDQWWWTLVLQGGAVFTAGYVVLVLTHALRRPTPSAAARELRPVSRLAEFAALGLALSSLLLALATLGLVPESLIKNPLAVSELVPSLLTVLGGAGLALGLARASLLRADRDEAVRRALRSCGEAAVRLDGALRRWPTASVALLLLAAAFGALLSGAISP